MKNDYEIRGDVTVIYLKRRDGSRLECLIDTENLELVDSFSGRWYGVWREDIQNYYVRGTQDEEMHYLHRWIINPPFDMQVDHINHNTLDNRRKNLRIVTPFQNLQNVRGAQKNNKSSGIRGVTKDKRTGLWVASIYVNRKRIYLGSYKDINQAALIVAEARAKLLPYSKEATNSKLKELQNLNIKDILEGRKPSVRNRSSGIRGVYFKKSSGNWYAQIVVNYKTIHLGTYSSKEEAELARLEAEEGFKNLRYGGRLCK